MFIHVTSLTYYCQIVQWSQVYMNNKINITVPLRRRYQIADTRVGDYCNSAV